jgi:two-component system, NarL family, invasion response regulator UvrY
MPKNILIADDHSSIRTGVKHICLAEFPSVQFGGATCYSEVFQKFKENDWDILILDVDLPGRNGLDILKQIRAEKNNIPVLIFSFHSERQIALRAMKIGASAGFIDSSFFSLKLSFRGSQCAF